MKPWEPYLRKIEEVSTEPVREIVRQAFAYGWNSRGLTDSKFIADLKPCYLDKPTELATEVLEVLDMETE